MQKEKSQLTLQKYKGLYEKKELKAESEKHM